MPTGNRSQRCYLGTHEEAGRLIPTFIPLSDRDIHTCIIGVSARWKSKLILQIFIGDLLRGEGYAILDPSGNLSDRLLDLIPPEPAGGTVFLHWLRPNWLPRSNPLAEFDVARLALQRTFSLTVAA